MAARAKLCRVAPGPTSAFGPEIRMPHRPGPRDSSPGRTGRLDKINHFGREIRFRFVLEINDLDTRSVVDERRFGCGRTRGAVAPIPQITSLDRGRPRSDPRDCKPAAKRRVARAGQPCAYQHILRIEVETACPCSKALSSPAAIP